MLKGLLVIKMANYLTFLFEKLSRAVSWTKKKALKGTWTWPLVHCPEPQTFVECGFLVRTVSINTLSLPQVIGKTLQGKMGH